MALPIMGRFQKPVGILDVAARAGVSAATVSRVYNTPEKVRAATRKAVMQAADDIGYIRNRLLGTLQHRTTDCVGLILPTVDNAIFAEMVQAFASRLLEHGRTMFLSTHGYDIALEAVLLRALLENRVGGVALIGLDHTGRTLELLRAGDVPAVSLWNYHADAAMPCVGVDNAEAGALAAAHLIDRGHRDIALMFPDTRGNDRARDRKTGALTRLLAAGIRPPPDHMPVCPYHIGAAKDIAGTLLARKNPPTALLCGNDVIAQGALFAARRRHIAVPDALSVIGIGDFRGSAEVEPALTTVRIPAQTIGKTGADMIVAAMHERGQGHAQASPPPAPQGIRVAPELVVRGSTGGPAPRRQIGIDSSRRNG